MSIWNQSICLESEEAFENHNKVPCGEFNMLLGKTAADLISRLEKAGSTASFEPGTDVLTINGRLAEAA